MSDNHIEYRTDCYFCKVDPDMGFTFKTCLYDLNNYTFGECKCSSNCKNYFSKKDIDKVIRKYLKQINLASNQYEMEEIEE